MLNSHAIEGIDAQIEIRRMEIRALALQAATRLHAALETSAGIITRRVREDAAHRTLMTARCFEQYIEEGTWKFDPEG